MSVTLLGSGEAAEPGTLVRRPRGKIVYEVVEVGTPGGLFVKALLRDTRTGRIRWEWPELLIRVEDES